MLCSICIQQLQVHEEATIADETRVEATARKFGYKEFRRYYDMFRDVHVGDVLRVGCEHGAVK